MEAKHLGRLLSAGDALAALAGGWFAVGDAVNSMWPHLGTAGVPTGLVTQAGLEKTGYFTGLGMVIVFVAALTLGGLLAPPPEPEAAASLPVGYETSRHNRVLRGWAPSQDRIGP